MSDVNDLSEQIIISLEENRFEQAKQILNELKGIETTIANIYYRIHQSYIQRTEGDYEQSYTMADEALKQANEHNIVHLQIKAMIEMGYCLWRQGRLTEAKDFIINLESFTQMEGDQVNPYDLANYLNLKGLINWNLGNFDKALELHQRAKSIRESMGRDILLAISYNNIGIVLLGQGQIQQAKIAIEKSLSLWQYTGDPRYLGYSYKNLGLVHSQARDFEKALDYLKTSYNYWKVINSKLDLSDVLLEIILLHILHNRSDIKSYLDELKHIHQTEDIKLIYLRYLLAKALVDKQEKTILKLADAQKTLMKILSSNFSDFRIYLLASINLCEIFLDELKISENNTTIDNLYKIVNKLYDFAQTQESYIFLVESLILKSKIFMIQSDLTSSQQAMDQAEITASEKNLHHLKDKINIEQQRIANLIKTWEMGMSNNLSMMERIKESEMLEYLKTIKESKFGY